VATQLRPMKNGGLSNPGVCGAATESHSDASPAISDQSVAKGLGSGSGQQNGPDGGEGRRRVLDGLDPGSDLRVYLVAGVRCVRSVYEPSSPSPRSEDDSYRLARLEAFVGGRAFGGIRRKRPGHWSRQGQVDQGPIAPNSPEEDRRAATSEPGPDGSKS
jgi:hypothetical protein